MMKIARCESVMDAGDDKQNLYDIDTLVCFVDMLGKIIVAWDRVFAGAWFVGISYWHKSIASFMRNGFLLMLHLNSRIEQ